MVARFRDGKRVATTLKGLQKTHSAPKQVRGTQMRGWRATGGGIPSYPAPGVQCWCNTEAALWLFPRLLVRRCSCPPTGYHPQGVCCLALGDGSCCQNTRRARATFPVALCLQVPRTARCMVVKPFNLLFIPSAVLKV